MGWQRQLLSHTTVYGGTTMLLRIANYLLLPFYTSVIPVASYGVMSELYSYIALGNVLYLYGMETTYFRFADTEASESSVFQQGFTSVLLSSLVLSGTIFVFAPYLAAWIGVGSSAYLLRLVAGVLLLDALASLPLARLRRKKQAVYFSICRATQAIVQIALTLFWLGLCPWILGQAAALPIWLVQGVQRVYKPTWDIEYVFLANVIGCLCYVFLLWNSWKQGLQLRAVRVLAKQVLAPMLRYAWPLLGMGLAGVGIEALPRVLFRHVYVGTPAEALHDLGLYSVAAKVAVIMAVALQAYRYAFEPLMLSAVRLTAPEQHKQRLAWSMRYYLYVAAWVFLSISLHLPWIGRLLLRQGVYQEGLLVVPLLLLAYVFLGMHYNLSVWYKVRKMTYYGLYFNGLGLLLVLLFTIYLVPQLGYMALGWAAMVAYATMAALSYLLGRWHYAVPYDLRLPMLLLGIAVVLVLGQVMGVWSVVGGWVVWGVYTVLWFYVLWREGALNKGP